MITIQSFKGSTVQRFMGSKLMGSKFIGSKVMGSKVQSSKDLWIHRFRVRYLWHC